MPATSAAQERLMQAAAHTKGGYGGVPQSVGKEFVSKDAELIRGAGIMLMAPDGRVLFIKRSKDSPHPGSWDFPGGKADDNETPEQTAKRECSEEIGALPYGELKPIYHEPDSEGVEFITYLMHIKQAFTPKLEESEHTKYKWRTLDDPPKNLHPGVQKVVNVMLGKSKDPGAENAKDIPAQDDFKESEHPRADNGQFGSGSNVSGKSAHVKASSIGGKHMSATGGDLPSHIQSLKIPPAWTDVTYSEDPNASLMATGKDSKGRPQSIYSKAFSESQAAAKFSRINDLSSKMHYIFDQNESARKSHDAKKSAAADCALLIMKTGIRPGSDNDTGAEKKAYGATTLQGNHVVVDGDNVSLQFVGKKGVSLNIPVDDAETKKMLIDRKNKAGDSGKLFPIDEKVLLNHVHSFDGGGFKTKDFRTLLGTQTAMDMVQLSVKPKNMAEYKKSVMDVAKAVSKKLGNTPTIALQSYINPSVFADWRIVA